MSMLLVAPLALAADDGASFEFFESRIRPLLVEHCYDCHSAEAGKAKGGLRLDSREGWAKGGDSGPAIVPGRPDDSLLIRGVHYWEKDFTMPPDEPLSPTQVADLVEWVKRGAPDPRKDTPGVIAVAKPALGIDLDKGRRHWAFQPMEMPPLPKVKDMSWPRTEVDYFTLAKMEAEVITPVQEADRRTLIRRVSFDLTGLPPTLEEVESFLKDGSAAAFERVVDRLLASPRYGERWGRHWLDVVRYADTCGNASDYPVPQAYKYRNYVIKAFNDDMPFDQFIREQIAGDLLPAASDGERFRHTVATGYLAISRRFGGGKGPVNLTIDDAIDNLGRSFLGLSVSCARCHDHKFDPVPQADYYALYGILSSTIFPHPGGEGMNRPANLVPLVTKPELEAATRPWQKHIKELEAEVKKLEAAKAALEKQSETSDKKDATARIEKKITAAKAKVKQAADTVPYELAYAVKDGKGADARLQVRGDPARMGEEVPRGFLQILGGEKLPQHHASSGRMELAQWVTDPGNPLTARVLVNRLWQHHFGRGLVSTPNDFGTRGQQPSHPELLDYLAQRFIQSGWSIKAMHRLLLLSHTWQLSSLAPEAVSTDPNDTLWWHAERRRLDAESIRDAMLFVSGDLDLTPGGEHPFPPVHTWGFTQHRQFFALYDNHQRSVYQMQQRLRKHPFLALFDGADTNSSTAVRDPSTTPLQSLFMMNNPFAHERAARLTARLTGMAAGDAQRVERVFHLLYSRPPEPEEVRMATEYLGKVRLQLAAQKVPAEQAWTSLVRALLGANEFLYLD
ncbi:MAG: PSD1 and planctomycete cytochrome C domain-containing protein [Prosthecobacter sp.]